MRTSAYRTKDLTLIALFAAILAICSWISIPTTIPFTMQTFGVFLTISILGSKRGIIAICIYLLLGIIGIPVYANGTSGIGILLGPTGGYMISWIFFGLILWGMELLFGKKLWVLTISLLLGLILCYGLGTVWFVVFYASGTGTVGFWGAFSCCVLPFILPDLVKLVFALIVQKKLTSFVK